ncbi:hypothetical protein OG875_20720 [Streptomyces sp. NBC_01498]|nr:hypothetical protein [Streptomyces sp. NBC_01498]WTL26773.1 hypothetical protein OG875_20720 [Streptomyces sp. NBC_01498]
MRRGLVHALAWTLATGSAVTLSWWGVHTVVVGTVYDRPRALPISADATRDTLPRSASTHRPPSPPPSPPSPSPSATRPPVSSEPPDPARTPDDDEPSASPPAPPSRERPPAAPGPDSGGHGEVRSYPVDGGRVVFDLGGDAGELVSATPESGWQMQVWKQDYWIRVTFTRDDREISVFCTWHDSAPRVQIDER